MVDYVKERHETDYSQAVIDALEHAEEAETPDEDTNESESDALFEQAVEMAVEAGQASISMLQRRLRVGMRARAGLSTKWPGGASSARPKAPSRAKCSSRARISM